MKLDRITVLPASTLKIIALITMIIDHIGYILFPEIKLLRIIGRLSFPIYAYLIGEGCKYSKNKKKYLLRILSIAIPYQLIDYWIHREISICILFVFSLFVVFTIIMDWAKKDWHKRFLIPELFAIVSCIGIFIINPPYTIFAFILPLIVYLCKDKLEVLLLYIASLALLGAFYGGTQFYGIIAIIPIAMYNNQIGKLKMKTLFYIMYPLHYLILGIIYYIIH